MQASDLGGIFPSVINTCVQYIILELLPTGVVFYLLFFCKCMQRSVREQGYKQVSESNIKYLIESFALVSQQAAWGDSTICQKMKS